MSRGDGLAYFNFRDALAADLVHGLVGQSAEELMDRAKSCSGADPAQVGAWLERFFDDLRREVARRKT